MRRSLSFNLGWRYENSVSISLCYEEARCWGEGLYSRFQTISRCIARTASFSVPLLDSPMDVLNASDLV